MGYVKQMSRSSLHQRDMKIRSRTHGLSPFLPEISSQNWHLTLPSASCFKKHFLNLTTPLSTITALYSLTPDHFISNISPLYQHIPDKTWRGAWGGWKIEEMWRLECYINSKSQIIANQIFYSQLNC